MRRRNITMWLGGPALLCLVVLCAASARAQSMDSQQAAAAEVSARDSANVRADVSADVGGGVASSANFSGSGGGSAMAAPRSGALPSRGRHARGFDALARGTGNAAKAGGSAINSGRSAATHRSMLNSYRAAHGSQAVDAMMTRAKRKSAHAGANPSAIHGFAAEPVTYSHGFADSTKGTALISPPDPGTTGPFAFNPNVNFKLPEFANHQFLAPRLHVGGRSGGKNADRRDARNRARSSAVSRPASPYEDLGLDVLRGDLGNGFASDPASDLGTTLSTSVHQ